MHSALNPPTNFSILTRRLEHIAYNSIVFKHPHTGTMRQAPGVFLGQFSFFGFFPPLFRGYWKWAVIVFVLSLLTTGLSNLVT